MRKNKIAKLTRRILSQLLSQSILIVLTALCAFMLMTWLIRDMLSVQHIYAAAGFEMLGMLVLLISVLVPLNVVLYRRRTREVITLSDAIQKVAAGDYASKIPTDKKTQITPVYEDFNKMCAELQSVQLLRNDFINSYSHEFKTPIASINGFAELLLDKELPEAEQRRYLKIIADESARLSKLASNSILLSRLSTQSIVSGQERYDLSEQLRECSVILSRKWLEKDIELSGAFPEVMFYGNKEMMQHLWLNLLDNAIKYTPEGGTITVDVSEAEDFAVVKIADTGEGISEDVKVHLFEPYFQGDSSHSGQGLGLGLSIVQRIVELCHGVISVESAVGEGSTFTVRLPRK